MAVQILIQSQNGKVVFSSPAAQQSDLVFWHNADAQPHYPVPGCTNLKVAPGQSTQGSPYQGFPDTTSQLPLTVNYICALHSGESGSIVISADTPATPPLGAPAIDPQNVAIHIRRGGGNVTFDTVDVAQGDSVYWVNDDNVEHWPVPNCTGLLTKPAQSSNPVQPATSNAPRSPYTNPGLVTTGPSPLPMAIAYGCAIAGHENESGTINIYDNLAPVLAQATPPVPAPTNAGQGLPVTIVTGGKSPYTIQQDPAHPQVTQIEQPPAGSSGGVAMVVNQAPSNTTISLQVNVTDALGKNLTQAITVII